MKKKTLVLTSVFLISVMLFASTAAGAVAQKNIKAYYRNIKIKVNGKFADAGQVEPFIYNDVVYVPIRLVSTALDKNVYWDNNQNTVVITDKTDPVKVNQEVQNLKQQISTKDLEINSLKMQNSFLNSRVLDLEKELSDYKSGKKDKDKYEDAAEDLEDYLYDEYSKWNKIKFDYSVKESRGDLTLTIEFDRRDYKSEWNDLSERKIENWLKDIYDYVKDEYPKAGFDGKIRDTDKRENLVEFKESRDKLKIDFLDSKNDDFYDLEKDLNKSYGRDLDSYHRDFGNLRADIKVEEGRYRDEIEITIEVDTSRYEKEWDRVKNTRDAEKWLEDIADYTLREYKDYTVYGRVEDSRGRLEAEFDGKYSRDIKIKWY